jgi:hypothetical protein
MRIDDEDTVTGASADGVIFVARKWGVGTSVEPFKLDEIDVRVLGRLVAVMDFVFLIGLIETVGGVADPLEVRLTDKSSPVWERLVLSVGMRCGHVRAECRQ